MEKIGESSLWTEKYRPACMADVVATAAVKKFFQNIIKDGEIPHLLLYGSAGIGKTTIATVVAKELDMDLLYINGSLETSIDTIRYKVQQFVMTHSLMGGKKLVILDECERISAAGQDSLKVLMEQAESNARFILCTNNLQKIIDPVQSRCQAFSFNYTKEELQAIMLQYFKRTCFILDNEGVAYEKAPIAEYVQKVFPDFRKIINGVHMYAKMNGSIDVGLLKTMDTSLVGGLIEEMKGRKFNSVRKICAEMDPSGFYAEFYSKVNDLLDPKCIPDVILILARYANQHTCTIDPEINLVACCVEIMQTAVWR